MSNVPNNTHSVVDENEFIDLKKIQEDYKPNLEKHVKKTSRQYKLAMDKKEVNNHDVLAFFLHDFLKFISKISNERELDAEMGIELAKTMSTLFTNYMSEQQIEGAIWESFTEALEENIKKGYFLILFENFQIELREKAIMFIKDKTTCCC